MSTSTIHQVNRQVDVFPCDDDIDEDDNIEQLLRESLQLRTTAPVAGKGNQHECPQARPQRACRPQAV
jgi:hypothetical protein